VLKPLLSEQERDGFFAFQIEEEIKCMWKTELSPIKSFIFLSLTFGLFLVGMIISVFFLKEDWELSHLIYFFKVS